MTNEQKKAKFPDGFLWGVAASSYQIEGGNSNSDWWEWEKLGKADDESGIACDYWNRYKEDHNFLEELGVNVFRTSIEWARIEPEEGVFSDDAIKHYREILTDLKRRGIMTQVTLWWWTSPVWFQDKYGFHDERSIAIFSRYVKKVTEELGDLIDLWTVLNEPMVPLGQGYLAGLFPPGSNYKSPLKARRAVNNLAKAYIASYGIIHNFHPKAQVGISYLYNWYITEGLGFLEAIVDRIARWWRIDLFGNKIKNYQDYVGVNYYRLGRMKFDPKNSTYMGFRIEENSEVGDGHTVIFTETREVYFNASFAIIIKLIK